MNFDQILPKKPHAECKFCQVVHEAQCETLAKVVAWLREHNKARHYSGSWAGVEEALMLDADDWQALQALAEDNKP